MSEAKKHLGENPTAAATETMPANEDHFVEVDQELLADLLAVDDQAREVARCLDGLSGLSNNIAAKTLPQLIE